MKSKQWSPVELEKRPKLYSTATSRRASHMSDSESSKPTPKQPAGTFLYPIGTPIFIKLTSLIL